MKRIKESKTLLLIATIVVPLLFIHFGNSSLVTAAYYGTVNQDGTVTVEGTTNCVEGCEGGTSRRSGCYSNRLHQH